MIAIGIPTAGSISVETVMSLLDVLSETLTTRLFFVKGSLIHANRTTIVLQALEAQCTHLFFIDSDMQLETGVLSKLLQHNKDIVSVNCYRKKLPLISVIVPLDKDNGKEMPNELFECESVGLACTLINLKIFESMPVPYFVQGWMEDGVTPLGEDIYFCKKAKQNGFKIWCDPTIKTGHIGDYCY